VTGHGGEISSNDEISPECWDSNWFVANPLSRAPHLVALLQDKMEVVACRYPPLAIAPPGDGQMNWVDNRWFSVPDEPVREQSSQRARYGLPQEIG